jgi:hypothetical protein
MYGLARNVADRTRSAPSPRAPGQEDACVAVILTVASLEAFANEVGHQARDPLLVPNVLAVAGNLMEEFELTASIEQKYMLLRVLLGGGLYDKGIPPTRTSRC